MGTGSTASRRRGRPRRPAAARYREALGLARDLDDRWTVRLVLGSLARLALADRQPERALRLAGAADVLEEAMGVGLLPRWRAAFDAIAYGLATGVDAGR